MLPEPYATDFRKNLSVFEWRIQWMYSDTGSNVTVGIGHLIPTPQAAAVLNWDAANGRAVDEYFAVKKAKPGLSAADYKNLSASRMSEAAIDALADTDTAAKWGQVNAAIPSFAGYPPAVQQALLDMAFNIGVGVPGGQHGLLSYRHMLASLDSRRWAIAATQCHRNGIQESRNEYAARLISGTA